MSRIRKANESAVEKTIAFLESLKIRYDNELKFNSTELQEKHEISKSTFSICKKLNFVKGGKWVVSDPNRNQALQVLEVLRQQASKRIDVALGEELDEGGVGATFDGRRRHLHLHGVAVAAGDRRSTASRLGVHPKHDGAVHDVI